MIWHKRPDIDELNNRGQGTAVSALGIEIVEVGDDFLKGSMPVDERTRQPLGLLHGGASVLFAESLGSIAANYVVDHEKAFCVGMEVNANHLRSVRAGVVSGFARPLHIGRSSQVWEIKIHDQKDRLICVSRLTMAVVQKNI
ncbi:MAG: hotdog fold thioesterase [Gammaproteobacteria bacterium]|nr:hotdog fold thioesterase [Gammaproteobacteria bacterium]MCW8909632.1 hotdog fold thioesterase [Gammaproteobacteria bacterium]MCW9004948.1 hotdog fold thioesterase [Gammaproteobacteria bacterium]MCW9056851.1 hotdog fold thioesterase [Gammaproteobacteria bacterium]